ncbi:MAG: tetratricopeptide repeat protein [Ktedonobacterales bacterium]
MSASLLSPSLAPLSLTAAVVAAIIVVLALVAATVWATHARASGRQPGRLAISTPPMTLAPAAAAPSDSTPVATTADETSAAAANANAIPGASLSPTSSISSSPAAPASVIVNDPPPVPLIPILTPPASATGTASNTSSATANATPRVFISHSTRDNDFGLRLAADLRGALGGEESAVWLDASGGLHGGDIWLDQIAAELTSREVFLIILSPAALASAWVRDELRMAWKQRNSASNKVIIPVLAEPCAVPEYLATIQFISFVPPRPYEEAFGEVLAAVRAGTTREVPLGRQASAPLGPPDDAALLPAPDHFVGRTLDVEWVLERLRDPGGGTAAITALRGLGGIGKTTLAAVAVRQLRDEGRFPEGIAVILCQGLTDPAEVLRRVLIRFDPYRRTPEASDLAGLAEAARLTLRGKRALLVLDNVEPGLPIAGVVAPLRAAGLTLLLTARQALPTAVVPVAASRALDLLSPDEALELFAGALGRGSPEAFSPHEYTAAEQIVRTLDRHTLAVKLAGAYAASERRDLGALARELADPERGLALPGDDETPAAVRRSFALSLDSLPLDARRLFAALAAFATPECGRAAVLVLGTALGQTQPETSLHLLLVRALAEPGVSEALPEGSDRERLRLHPLLGAFAADLFARWPAGERDAAALAVARHFAGYAETHQTEDSVLAADEGNLTGALEWAQAHEQAALVADLAHGLRLFWDHRGRYRDGVRFLAWGVAAAAARQPAVESGAARGQTAELNLAYGQLLIRSGQPEAGEVALSHSLESFRTMRDRRGEGMALSALGEAALYRGQYAAAEDYLRQSLALCREVGNRQGEGEALSELGQVALYHRQFEAAEEHLQQGLVILREVGDRRGEGLDLNLLGNVALWRDHYAAAEGYLRQSLVILREVGDRQGEGVTLSQLGQVTLHRGQFEVAEGYLQQSLVILREVGARRGEGTNLSYLGQLALRRGQNDMAEGYLQESLNIRREEGDRQGEGVGLNYLGQLALRREQYDVAEEYLRQSLAIAREVGNRQSEGGNLSLLGLIELQREQYKAAEEHMRQGLPISREVGDSRWEARALQYLGRTAEAQADLDRAETLFRDSLAIATARDLGPEIAEAQLALGRLLAERLDRREEGCPLLLEASRRFAAMGMPEVVAAREAVARLGCTP